MKDKKTIKHLIIVFLLIIATAIIFAVISTTQLFQQIHDDSSQLAGQIVSVSEHEVIIRDKRGKETILMINEDTEIRGNVDELAPGQFVHTFGIKLSNESFESKDIRVIKKP